MSMPGIYISNELKNQIQNDEVFKADQSQAQQQQQQQTQQSKNGSQRRLSLVTNTETGKTDVNDSPDQLTDRTLFDEITNLQYKHKKLPTTPSPYIKTPQYQDQSSSYYNNGLDDSSSTYSSYKNSGQSARYNDNYNPYTSYQSRKGLGDLDSNNDGYSRIYDKIISKTKDVYDDQSSADSYSATKGEYNEETDDISDDNDIKYPVYSKQMKKKQPYNNEYKATTKVNFFFS
jgi:hypothetical protein